MVINVMDVLGHKTETSQQVSPFSTPLDGNYIVLYHTNTH